MATSLQEAYDSAAVVFSRSFRFVEWKFVIAAEPSSVPFGDKDEPQHKAVKPIAGERWIYVFRHEGSGYASLKEEIWLSSKGDMYATPEPYDGKGAEKKPVSLGKTLSLPRRVLGQAKVYRFYASRVRLSKAQVDLLQSNIAKFAPRTSLEPTKNTSVVVKDGELLVPVVDPITVALHLHAAYEAAANDLINYTTPHAGLSKDDLALVGRRRKKQLLAQLMKALIGEKEKDTPATSKLVHELKDMQYGIETFLTHYDEEVRYRARHRDHMANLLVKWLSSDAMRVAAKAHEAAGGDAWARFLASWCRSIGRLGESLPGRDYLSALLADSKHFANSYVWPQGDLSNEQFQAVRKGGLAVIEGWRTIAEARILIKGGTGVVDEVVDTLKRLRRWKLDNSKLTTKTLKEVKSINRSITATQLILPVADKDIHYVASELRGLGFIIESVNLLFAIRAAMDENLTPRERELAIIGLVGSSLDATSALATLLKKSERAIAVLGFVSGVIDVYLGVQDMDKAFKQGDQDAADAAFVTAVGASVTTSGALMTLMAIPGGQIVGAIGLAITGAGYIYKILTSKTDLDVFFLHSSWGKQFGVAGEADWSPVRFEKWESDKDKAFDYQLEALLNILCKFEVSSGDTYRDLKFKLGWVPSGASLAVKYGETWQKSADSREKQTEVKFDPPVSSDASFSAAADGAHGLKLTVLASAMVKKSTNQDLKIGGKRLRAEGLKRVEVKAALMVGFDATGSISIPHKGYTKVLYKD